jgi:predicted permease
MAPFSSVGHTTLILALIYVGYILSGMKFQDMLKVKSVYVLSFNKLLLVPILLFCVLLCLKNVFPFLNNTAINVIVIQAGMPAMATVAILARRYKSDEILAGQNIFLSTILSIITLPLLLFIINLFLRNA